MRAIRQGGFSFVELMVVIAIIGIAAGVAVPSIRDFMRLSEVTAAGAEMVTALSTARNEAMKFGNNVGIRPQAGQGWCALYVVDVASVPSCDLTSPANTTVRLWDQKARVAYSIVVTAASSGVDTIIFNRSGRLHSTQSAGCVQVSAIDNSALRRCIRVNAGGGISTDASSSCTCS